MLQIRSIRLSAVFFAVLLFTVIILILGYSIYGSPFVENFLTYWLSTFLGAAAGILAIVWLKEYLEREGKQKIISLIKEELEANKNVLASMIEEQQREKFTYVYLTLRDDLWKALSASGELREIKDPGVIGRLSNAYGLIRITADLSEKYYRHTYLNNLGEDVRSVTRTTLCVMTLQAAKIVEDTMEFVDSREI